MVPRRNLSRLAVKYRRGKWAARGEKRKEEKKKRRRRKAISSNAFPLCTAMYLVRIMLLGNLSVF